uniref:Dol-P-Glc:Glc(2)Man(9)GlcNAc(2)-PP-Dol alpha-1,2-glucosyltransferase n=1 Tax=Timema genevievae TaxID=629358 RepID=A0A7R9PMX1_TIMGE|nr:unnamed protein product [Timema genevievae]
MIGQLFKLRAGKLAGDIRMLCWRARTCTSRQSLVLGEALLQVDVEPRSVCLIQVGLRSVRSVGALLQTSQMGAELEIGLLSAFNLATFPLIYFFTFLYYTDTVSTSLVLLMYLFHLYGHNFLSAASGFIAVTVRQTNIIWVGFILLKIVENVLKDKAIAYKRKVTPQTLRSSKYFQILILTIQQSWKSGFSSFSALIIDILHESSLFIIVCLSFVTFVIWNGSIVVGDKNAHQAVLNFPQLFYFSLFTLCFCFPYFITFTPTFFHWCVANKKSLAIISLICVLIVGFNTHVHPYLLADNRHYTFYIWKRVFERHFLFKYMLIPFYVFGLFAGFQILKNTSVTYCAFYIFCFMLCLVPQKLLEFRYFILPYLFLRLQIPQSSWWPLIIEFFIYTAVNALTIYLFLSRTFIWADSPELQRFLW